MSADRSRSGGTHTIATPSRVAMAAASDCVAAVAVTSTEPRPAWASISDRSAACA